MKGLILSGGRGTRLRPITFTSAKQLVPVANKPILFYGIEALAASGILEIGIVVGDTRQEIRDAVGDGSGFGVSVTYIEQEAPLGLAHAVLVSERFLGTDPFCMYLGDNLIRERLAPLVTRFREEKPNSQILLAAVPNPSQFGVAELRDGQVVRLIEKPKRELIFPWPNCLTYLWDSYKKILIRADLPHDYKSKFHRMRKSVASHFEAAGGNATALLDHSHRRTTEKYIDPTICVRQHAVDLLFRPDMNDGGAT